MMSDRRPCRRLGWSDLPIELLLSYIVPCLEAEDSNRLLTTCKSWSALLQYTRSMNLKYEQTRRFCYDRKYREKVLYLIGHQSQPAQTKTQAQAEAPGRLLMPAVALRRLTFHFNKLPTPENLALLTSVEEYIAKIRVNPAGNTLPAAVAQHLTMKVMNQRFPRLCELALIDTKYRFMIPRLSKLHCLQMINGKAWYEIFSVNELQNHIATIFAGDYQSFDWRQLQGIRSIRLKHTARDYQCLVAISPQYTKLEEVCFEDCDDVDCFRLFAGVDRVTFLRCNSDVNMELFSSSKEVHLEGMTVTQIEAIQDAAKVVLDNVIVEDISALWRVKELHVKNSISVTTFPTASGKRQKWVFDSVGLSQQDLTKVSKVHDLTLIDCFNVKDVSPLQDVQKLTWSSRRCTTIPGLSQMTNLRSLTIQSTFSELESLHTLQHLEEVELSKEGYFPASLANVPNLRVLALRGNIYNFNPMFIAHLKRVHLYNFMHWLDVSNLGSVGELRLEGCQFLTSSVKLSNIYGKGVPREWMSAEAKWYFHNDMAHCMMQYV